MKTDQSQLNQKEPFTISWSNITPEQKDRYINAIDNSPPDFYRDIIAEYALSRLAYVTDGEEITNHHYFYDFLRAMYTAFAETAKEYQAATIEAALKEQPSE